MPKRKRSRKPTKPIPKFSIPILALFGVLFLFSVGTYETAARVEEHDAFCASCHTEPETSYYQNSLAADPVDLAAWHHGQEVRCIDCHAGKGLPGRLGAMRIGAGDLVAYLAHTAKQPAPLTSPIGDSHCLKCHQDVTQTQDFNRHFHVFLAQWQQLDPQAGTCVSCHTAHTADGDPNLSFLQQDRTVQVCEACHGFRG
ncbi:MAG: cytochrome c3 family protein [Anaerolineales bacterium]|jgi:predicted CXXCH cytochrome family protein